MPSEHFEPANMRINRALAFLGLGSRRGVEKYIEQGRVEVNGETVNEFHVRVDPFHDEIRVDGEQVEPPPLLYCAYHKPPDVVSSLDDQRGREDLSPVAEEIGGGVFPVGRLDRESEGLIIFTNDGKVANYLLHPSHGCTKEYRLSLRGSIERSALERMQGGIELDDGTARLVDWELLHSSGEQSELLVTVVEGRKRMLRRMFRKIDHPVTRLVRVRQGPVELGGLEAGEFRELSEEEISQLVKRAEATQ